MKEPLVSIIVASHNHSSCIEAFIDSIYNQTYQNIEIIFMDNYSTDATQEMLSQYGPKVKIVDEPTDSRVAAFAKGLHHASGEFVVPCQADNIFLENDALEKSVKVLMGDIHTYAVVRDSILISQLDEMKCPSYGRDFDFYEYCSQEMKMPFCGAMFRKHSVNCLGFPDKTWEKGAEEYEFWIEFARHFRIEYEEGFIISCPSYQHQWTGNPRKLVKTYHVCVKTFSRIFDHAQFWQNNRDLKHNCLIALNEVFHEKLSALGMNQEAEAVASHANEWKSILKCSLGMKKAMSYYLAKAIYRLYRGKFKRAKDALKLAFKDQSNLLKYAESLVHIHQIDQAIDVLTTYIENVKKPFEAYDLLASIHEKRGSIDEAIAFWDKTHDWDNNHAHSMAMLARLKSPNITNNGLLEAHNTYVKKYIPDTVSNTSLARSNTGKKIRVAFHWRCWDIPTIRFQLIPALRNIDRSKFEVIGYDHVNSSPEVESVCDLFRPIEEMTEADFSQKVRSDNVDIFIELCGFCPGHRFVAMAHRCAPVQVSYLNYTSTCAVPNVDYILADEFCILPEEKQYFTEKVYDIPGCFFCFNYENAYLPEVKPLPSLKNKYITFGCFGSGGKINPKLIEMWAKVLKAVPDSMVYIRNNELGPNDNREHMIRLFQSHGIQRERLRIRQGTDRLGVLRSYNEVDITFDTWPYCGGNTIAESLWQGVPVVSLCGDRFSSRYGGSLLRASGCGDLVANTEAQYVQIAKDLARSPEKLMHYRKNLRQMTFDYGFSNAQSFAKKLETAFEDMLCKLN